MTLIDALDFAAVVVFAISGALAASRAQLDMVGFAFVACLTAVGGGTIRDLLLDRDEIFWIANTTYIGIAVLVAFTVFFTAHLFESRLKALTWADAVALAVAVSAGVGVAREAGPTARDRHHHGDRNGMFRRADAGRGVQRGATGAQTRRALRVGGLRGRACGGGREFCNTVPDRDDGGLRACDFRLARGQSAVRLVSARLQIPPAAQLGQRGVMPRKSV